VTEGLAGIVKQTFKNQLFQRMNIENNRVKVSLSQFADNILLSTLISFEQIKLKKFINNNK